MNGFTDEEKNIFGITNFRNQAVKFGIKTDDRRRHVYVIGKTGSGKSKLLEIMAINDIRSGKGVGVVDPHGEFAENMLNYIPEDRIDDVIYFNPSDINYPVAFNPLEHVAAEYRYLIASGMMGVFKKIWVDAWSPRMAYILNNTLLALLEYPDATLLGVMRMFSEPEYRKKIVMELKDPVVKSFWTNEYARYSQKFETEAVAAIQNKVGQFVSNPLIRNIIGQSRSAINMRQVMDEKKIFIANLSKGKIGEDNSALLGAMLISRIQLAAMSRVDTLEEERNDFHLYVDEFQNFATDSFASILSEARKYHLCLTLAHQYIEQLDEKVRPAVFGNVGTIVCFRVGAADAEFLEKEFMPTFTATDLVNLEKRNIYLRLLIDGVASQPFSAETIDLPQAPETKFVDAIIENTRNKFALPRRMVEEKIASEWLSEAAAFDKVSRRSEQPLERILGNTNTPVIKRSPFYGQSQSGRPSGPRERSEPASPYSRPSRPFYPQEPEHGPRKEGSASNSGRGSEPVPLASRAAGSPQPRPAASLRGERAEAGQSERGEPASPFRKAAEAKRPGSFPPVSGRGLEPGLLHDAGRDKRGPFPPKEEPKEDRDREERSKANIEDLRKALSERLKQRSDNSDSKN